jgi:uncharacterized membrane protein
MLNSAGFYIVLLMGYAVYAILVVWRVPRNICLGAIVPEDKRDDPKCRRLKRHYYWSVTLFAVVFIVLIRFQQTQLMELNMDGMRMGVLLLVYLCFTLLNFYYHRMQMLKCVREENWLPDREGGTIVVDTTFHQKRKSISPLWLLLVPLIIIGTLVIYSNFRPELYSGRFFDTFAELGIKGKWNVLHGYCTTCKNIIIAIQVYLGVIAAITFYGYSTARQALDPKDPDGSLEKELKRRKTLQANHLVIYLVCCLFFAALPFLSLKNYMLAVFSFYILPLYLLICGLPIYLLAQTGSIEARKNVPGNLPATMFYNDPDDSALFIWNRSGLGVLLNWGNPRGKIITIGGVVLMPVMVLVLFCYLAPVTNFLPNYDISQSRQQDIRDGVRCFADAVSASESQRERIGDLSVKGSIERLAISQKDGEPPVSRWEARNAIWDYIDGKRSFESLGELFQVKTIRNDKVLFANVRPYAADPEQQALRELAQSQGKTPDNTLLPRSDDGYLVSYEQAVHDYLREHYKGFDFFRMGQVQGKLVETFARETRDIGLMAIGDFEFMRILNVQQFIRDATILSEYHGFVILSSGERLAHPPTPSDTTRIWSADMVLPNRRGYSLRNEILIKPAQNSISPKCLYLSGTDKMEAYFSSEYFSPTPGAWLPKYFTAIFVDTCSNDDIFAHVVRVNLEPNTAQSRRGFRE